MNSPEEEAAIRLMEGKHLANLLMRRGINLHTEKELNQAIQAYACAASRHAVAIVYKVQAEKGQK